MSEVLRGATMKFFTDYLQNFEGDAVLFHQPAGQR